MSEVKIPMKDFERLIELAGLLKNKKAAHLILEILEKHDPLVN